MPGDCGGQRIGLGLCQFQVIAVGQHDAVAHDPQMHRVGTQPVGFTGHAAIRLKADRRHWPVLLAGDTQRLAQGRFHALGRTGLATAARQQGLQCRQAQILRRGFQQPGRGEEMGDDEQHAPSVAKPIR